MWPSHFIKLIFDGTVLWVSEGIQIHPHRITSNMKETRLTQLLILARSSDGGACSVWNGGLLYPHSHNHHSIFNSDKSNKYKCHIVNKTLEYYVLETKLRVFRFTNEAIHSLRHLVNEAPL